MSQNFQRGDFAPTLWAPVSLNGVGATGAQQALNVRADSIDIEALLFDVTNTGSGGGTARLAGKYDASGNVEADFDLDIPPYLAPLYLLPGQSGLFGKMVSASLNIPAGGLYEAPPPAPLKVIQLPTIISKVHYQSGVESDVKYNFDVKMNVRAGLLVWPSA